MRIILTNTFFGVYYGIIIATLIPTTLIVISSIYSLGISGLWLGVSGGLFVSFSTAFFFGFIPGSIIGATVGIARFIAQYNQQINHQSNTISTKYFRLNYHIMATIIGMFLGAIISVILITYLFMFQVGIERYVIHQMQAFVGKELCADGQKSVYFVYSDYPRSSEYFCSNALAAFIQEQHLTTLSVRFAATYDFGNVRGFHIESVESIPPDLLQNMGGSGTGCLDPVLPACDSTLLRQDNPWD